MRLFSIFFPPGQVTHLAFFFLGQVIHDNSTISKIFEFHQKNLYVFPLCALSSPHFKYFQNNSSFLDMVSLLYLILFFLYKAYYLKSLQKKIDFLSQFGYSIRIPRKQQTLVYIGRAIKSRYPNPVYDQFAVILNLQ